MVNKSIKEKEIKSFLTILSLVLLLLLLLCACSGERGPKGDKGDQGEQGVSAEFVKKELTRSRLRGYILSEKALKLVRDSSNIIYA